MKLQLGIFQEQEQINQYLEAKGIGHNDLVIAGPFPTRLRAIEWMDYIEKKTGQGTMERHAVGLMNQQPWYGLTFEKKPAVPARKNMPASSMETAAGLH
ncbi:hypothetical protein [Desulfobulbus propionicus]|nr:hypothetical protein [Clostridia bacterium]